MDEQLERKIEELKRHNPNMTKQLELDIEHLQQGIEKYKRNYDRMSKERADRKYWQIQLRALALQEQYDLNLDAAEFKLDDEAFLLLKTFEEECLIERCEGDQYGYIEDLKPFQDEIRRMGQIFESLRLAKRLKKAKLAWKPRGTLNNIIWKRIAPRKHEFNLEEEDGVHKLNLATVRTFLEVGDVAAVIVDVMSALGVNNKRDDGWRLNRALRQLLISTSVKGYFSSASARGFLAPQLRLVADLPVMTTV